MTQNDDQNPSSLKIQRVKNYDAKDIDGGSQTQKKKANKPTKSVSEQHDNKKVTKQSQEQVSDFVNKNETKSEQSKDSKRPQTTPNGQDVTLLGKQGGALVKFLICLTYLMSLFVVLYVLPSWWWFLGMVGLAVPLLMFFVAKDSSLKRTGGRLFFINLCATFVSGLFWVLYLTTRRFGIGFLSSMMRALQIAGAVVGVALAIYFFLDFATSGKTSLPWIAKMTKKTEDKMSAIASKAK